MDSWMLFKKFWNLSGFQKRQALLYIEAQLKKYQHLNYVEKTQIERWYNIEKKACSEIAKLLNKSARTIQREIKRGMVENLTTQLEIKYVYSVDVSEKKYRYNMTAKGPNLK